MLSFWQNLGKRKSLSQPIVADSGSTGSAPSQSTCSTSRGASTSNSDALSLTPPTSNADSIKDTVATTPKPRKLETGSRPLRHSRPTVASYNENILSGSAKGPYRRRANRLTSRVISSETLVDSKDGSSGLTRKKTPEHDHDQSGIPPLGEQSSITTKSQVTGGPKSPGLDVLQMVSHLFEQTKTVLGKRPRIQTEGESEKAQAMRKNAMGGKPEQDPTTLGIESLRRKRARSENIFKEERSVIQPLSTIEQKSSRQPAKRWLERGLYVGQDPDFNPRLTTNQNLKKKAIKKENASRAHKRSILPLPMFAGRRVLEVGGDFRLPFDIFSPLPPGQPRPDEWKKTHKSKLSVC